MASYSDKRGPETAYDLGGRGSIPPFRQHQMCLSVEVLTTAS